MFAAVVFLLISGLIIYRAVIWVMQAQRSPDPWDAETDKALESEEAKPLCHHCLTAQEHNGWFCPNCGATVGPYVNYLPYVYLFSEGEVLRNGVAQHLPRSPLIVAGYILLTLSFLPILAVLFFIWAPVYWFLLMQNFVTQKTTIEENV